MLPDCFTNNMGSFSNVRERKEEWKDVESGGGSPIETWSEGST